MNPRFELFIKGRDRLATPYHMKGVGLPNVYLLNGVTIEHDAEHGPLVTIDDIPGMYRAIGLAIVSKPDVMTGDELRFLRKQMRLTQEALAQRLRVTVQTAANYEKGKTVNMGPAEIAMRLLFVLHVLPPDVQGDLVRDYLEAIVTAKVQPRMPQTVLKKIVGRWQSDGSKLAA